MSAPRNARSAPSSWGKPLRSIRAVQDIAHRVPRSPQFNDVREGPVLEVAVREEDHEPGGISPGRGFLGDQLSGQLVVKVADFHLNGDAG